MPRCWTYTDCDLLPSTAAWACGHVLSPPPGSARWPRRTAWTSSVCSIPWTTCQTCCWAWRPPVQRAAWWRLPSRTRVTCLTPWGRSTLWTTTCNWRTSWSKAELTSCASRWIFLVVPITVVMFGATARHVLREATQNRWSMPLRVCILINKSDSCYCWTQLLFASNWIRRILERLF